MPNPSLRIIVLTPQQMSTICTCVHGQPRRKWHCQAAGALPAGQAFSLLHRSIQHLAACPSPKDTAPALSLFTCTTSARPPGTPGFPRLPRAARQPPSHGWCPPHGRRVLLRKTHFLLPKGDRDAVFSTPSATSCNVNGSSLLKTFLGIAFPC